MFEFINSRFSILKRMSFICGLFYIPTFIVLWLFVGQCWSNVTIAQSEISGGNFIKIIWPNLVSNAPQSYGDDFLQKAVQFSPAKIANDFLSASSADDRVKTGIVLIRAVADGSQLTLDPDLDSFYTQDAVTVRLPKIIAAVLALKQAINTPSPDQRAAIIIAVKQLSEANAAAQNSLSLAMNDNSAGITKEVLAQPTMELETAVTALINQGRLDETTSGITNAEALEDQVINSTNNVYLVAQKELIRLLHVRVQKTEQYMAFSLAICGLALLIATGIAAGVGLGLTRRITMQVKTMETLAKDDTSIVIPYLNDRNETGRIAVALEIFKAGLIDRARLKKETESLHEISEKKLRDTEAAFVSAGQEQAQLVEALSAALAKLATGDLTVSIQSVSKNYEKTKTDFNDAVSNLKSVVDEISSMAVRLRVGANEISSASNDISQRTEQQAASLEETAAALNQITKAVQSSAQGATLAQEAVTSSKNSAVRSGDIMSETVSAIEEIQNSSDKIQQIISLIDEISFQTNLLALNAGVEAARAGDAGRGFAVVATEVRALAQRSADAAKEIKTLIASSSSHVQRGVHLVSETGEALGSITEKINDVNNLIADISSSSKEQSIGLCEVNAAVNQMDKVTQQNAAMIEETASSVKNLYDETKRLEDLVSHFHTA